MHKVQTTPGRRFLKHGGLVLLPLVLLTAMAVSWLRQDQYAVKESAKEVAKLSSKESVRRIQEQLNSLAKESITNDRNSVIRIQLAADGRLLSPAPRDLLPVPKPYPVERLEPREKALWLNAMAAGGTVNMRSNAWARFLEASPTNEWRELGQYQLALTLAEEQPEAASKLLKEIFTHPQAVQLESGVPLVPLAELRWMEMNSNLVTGEVVEHFSSNVVKHASFLTPILLTQTICRVGKPNADWLSKWQRDETARSLYARGGELWNERKGTNTVPVLGWLEGKDGVWLTILEPRRNEVTAVAWSEAAETVRKELEASAVHTATVVYQAKVAGRVVADPFSEGEIRAGHQVEIPAEAETLAVASADEGGQPVEVTAFLWKNTYYRAARQERFLMFSTVITLAVVVALTGLASAWRTFHEQWQISEMKSNFVSSVSHELRAPLASVRLMAESLERGKVNEPARQQEYFQLIGRECRRLTALIENVLDFARIDQGRKQYQMEPTDVVILMQHTVKGMEAYAAERKVTLKLEIEGEPREVEMDGQAIQQAVINLIDNAVKYSPENEEVRVKLEFDDKFVYLAVRDEGPGIPVHERERIFERFYRRGRELRRETPGVGIGLSIVKHVVEAHGGMVSPADVKGRGSFFVIVLPAAKVGDKLTGI